MSSKGHVFTQSAKGPSHIAMTALQPAQPSLDSSPGSPVHEPRDSLDLPDLYSAETMWSDLELQQLDGAARGLTEMGAGSSAASSG